MPESQNVQIPVSLFNMILVFFEYLNASNLNFPTQFNFDAILSALHSKQLALNSRSAYSKFVRAKDENAKSAALADYLRLKRNNPPG
jgi:hypothetical protein